MDAVLALTREGYAFVASDARVLVWNDAAAQLTGLKADDVLDRDVRSVLLEGAAIVNVPFDGARRTLRVGVEVRPVPRWYAVEVIGIDVDARSHGWLCCFGLERRHREIEQLKNEIVATVSHELKTPIATIKAFADGLRGDAGGVSSTRDDYLRVIDEQADRLTRAVDDLLLASRVEADQLLSQRVTLAVDDVLDAALAGMTVVVASHPIERRTLGARVSGDPELLGEILRHLIDNASKFSRRGAPIAIDARSDDGVTTIDVRDRGIGIDADHLPYVFERFYRVENPLTAESSGAGLGLFIVAALVRAHGGTVSAESRPGDGTVFTVSLPVRA